MDKDISALLQAIRAETGWSEPRLAQEIGVSQPTVNRILRGQMDCKGSTLASIVKVHDRLCQRIRRKAKNSTT